jgi:cytochrome bd ubiquinol oxidase subunit I
VPTRQETMAASGFANAEAGALCIGGWSNERTRQTGGAIEIPGALSMLAYGDTSAVVRSLDDFPRRDTPPALIVKQSSAPRG